MSKISRQSHLVLLSGICTVIIALMLMLFLNKACCPVLESGTPGLSSGNLSLCNLKLTGSSVDFHLENPAAFSLYIPNDRGCTLTVNGKEYFSKYDQEYLVCPLSGFSPDNEPADFHAELYCPFGYDPYFDNNPLYLGTRARIEGLILAGSFQRFFVIGIAFTILLYSLSLYAGKPSEKYLLFLALLAYSTSARTLWNARPVLKQIPLTNLLLLGTIDFPWFGHPLNYHLSFMALKLLIAWLRCRLLGEFVSVKIGGRSYFSLCLPSFLIALPFGFWNLGYYSAQIWIILVHLCEFFVLVRGAANHLRTCMTLTAAWGLTLVLRLCDLAFTAGILSHGFLEAALKPQGIIETFYIIAFVAVINLKFAHKYQEADRLSVSLEETNRNLEAIVASRTRELSDTCRRLNEIQQQKSEFMANIIHNLKTPLFSLYGYADMALDEIEDAPELARKHIMEINKNTSYARQLIDNLFLCMRLEDGKVQYNRLPFPVTMLLEQLRSTSLPKTKAAGIELVIEPCRSSIMLHGDLLYLRQAFQNMIDNGIRHSPAHTVIRISAEIPDTIVPQTAAGSEAVPAPARCVCITLRDQGEGISPEEMPLIFSRYYSGGRKGASSSGLGLTISKGIIEQHGGRIEVESTLNQGTTFRIYLPCTTAFP